MQSSVAVLLVGAVLAVHGAVKEKPAGGYYDAAQSQPSYPQQSPPSYQPQPPVYYQPVYQPPQFALPNVDVNYCTVHASFPLVERRKHHGHHRRDRRQTYGQDTYNGVQQSPASSYGQSAPSYIPPYPSPFTGHHARRFERQHCRYSAIFDQATCQTCCQIASAAAGTDTSAVTGALFVFDPKNIDSHHYYDSKSKSEEHKDDKDEKHVLQCICCLPKPL